MSPEALHLIDTIVRVAIPVACSVLFLMVWKGESK
jgi:hypothetical protein